MTVAPPFAPGTLSARPDERTALLSADGAYRYTLTRRWGDRAPAVVWIMLNPSTADDAVDDPTIRRCVGFTRGWGYDAITVVNLYALRATDPDILRGAADPVGPDNDHTLSAHASAAVGLKVAAWGAHPLAAGRARHLLARGVLPAAGLACLGVTAAGQPRHPLYVPAAQPTRQWNPPDGGWPAARSTR
jgi:hypothetical protein